MLVSSQFPKPYPIPPFLSPQIMSGRLNESNNQGHSCKSSETSSFNFSEIVSIKCMCPILSSYIPFIKRIPSMQIIKI